MRRYLLMLVLAAACNPQADRNEQLAADAGAQEVLASLDGDTVRLVADGEGGVQIVWSSSHSRLRPERWTSRALPRARPEVRLAYINDDSLPDLFWTLRHEEILGGMLLLANSDSAVQVFVTGDDECSVPELIDVDSDGLLDIVRYTAGVIRASECEGDAFAVTCQEHFPTDWAWPLFQRSSQFTEDQLAAGAFYADRATVYRRGATDLENAIRDGAMPSPRCDESMVHALRRLAARADSLAAVGPGS